MRFRVKALDAAEAHAKVKHELGKRFYRVDRSTHGGYVGEEVEKGVPPEHSRKSHVDRLAQFHARKAVESRHNPKLARYHSAEAQRYRKMNDHDEKQYPDRREVSEKFVPRVEPVMGDGKDPSNRTTERGEKGRFRSTVRKAPMVSLEPRDRKGGGSSSGNAAVDRARGRTAKPGNAISRFLDKHIKVATWDDHLPKRVDRSKEPPMSRGSGPSGEHLTFHINKDRSVDLEDSEGRYNLNGPMKNLSSVHPHVIDYMKRLRHMGDDRHIHVKDSSGDWGRMMRKRDETLADNEKSRKRGLEPTNFVKREDVPEHTYSEETMHEEKKFAPKPLRDIVPKPARRWSEYDGNTPDEQKIVSDFRKGIVHADRNGNGDEVFKASKVKRDEKPVVPGDDESIYAGHNGDVANVGDSGETVHSYPGFYRSLSKRMARIGESCTVGQEVHYGRRSPSGLRIRKATIVEVKGKKLFLDSGAVLHHGDEVGHRHEIDGHGVFTPVKESLDEGTLVEAEGDGKVPNLVGSHQVHPNNMDYHWATVHHAPVGSRVTAEGPGGKDARIVHPDGEVHHVTDGAVHTSNVRYGHEEGKSHANSGRFVVAKVTDDYGLADHRNVHFVSDRRAKGYISGHTHTAREEQAKEFKTRVQAQNHAGWMQHVHDQYANETDPEKKSWGLGRHSTWVVAPKRTPGQIAKSRKEVDAAMKAHTDAAAKHRDTFRQGSGTETSDAAKKSWAKLNDSWKEVQRARHKAVFDSI